MTLREVTMTCPYPSMPSHQCMWDKCTRLVCRAHCLVTKWCLPSSENTDCARGAFLQPLSDTVQRARSGRENINRRGKVPTGPGRGCPFPRAWPALWGPASVWVSTVPSTHMPQQRHTGPWGHHTLMWSDTHQEWKLGKLHWEGA